MGALLGLPTAASSQYCVYVANRHSDDLSVIDPNTHRVVATVPLGGDPEHVTFSLDGGVAYVTLPDSNAVAVIDTNAHQVVNTISVPGHPVGLAVSPDGRTAYVARSFDNAISPIDLSSAAVNDSIVVPGESPRRLVVTADGSFVYAVSDGFNLLDEDDPTLNVIDTATNSLTASIPLDRTLGDWIDIDQSTGHVYIAAGGIGGSLMEIDVMAERVSTFGGFLGARGLAIKSRRGIYVAENFDDKVSVFDRVLASKVTSIPVGDNPQGIALTPDGNTLYVANGNSGTVSVIDTQRNTVVTTIGVGSFPIDVGVLPHTCAVPTTPTETPIPGPTPGPCYGDCNDDGSVTVNELIIGVNIAVGNQGIDSCRQFDTNYNDQVTVNELIQGVNSALNGCAG